MHDNNMLLWLDLETTGSDVDLDEIIEVACVLTDNQLNEVGMTFNRVASVSSKGVARMWANDAVFEMHDANGLLRDCRSGFSIQEIDRQLYEALSELPDASRLTLAGSGVGHFDIKFVRAYMPLLAKRLEYYVIDVGVLRRTWRLWHGEDLTDVNTRKTHRALDDVFCHLEEARKFRELFRGGFMWMETQRVASQEQRHFL
jgi:oligoribonuclease